MRRWVGTSTTVCGLAGLGSDGRRTPVYVHSKLMLVDEVWATVGSANLHRFTLFGNAELNAATSSPELVRAFGTALSSEHLAVDTSGMDARAAVHQFGRVAGENRERYARGDPAWQGQAIELDGSSYGLAPQLM